MTAAAPSRAGQARRASPAESHALLRSLDELSALLLETLAGGFTLDAFLLAAGMHQVVADELHPDPLRLDESATFLDSRIVRLAGQAAQVLRRPFLNRAARRCERQLAGLVDLLAGAVMRSEQPGEDALRAAAAVADTVESLPARIRAAVLRLPACFHDFDQRPEDVARLAAEVAGRLERSERLVVLGVRTSGSYLAPLHAACLRGLGFEHVAVVTARPGRRFLPVERAVLRGADRVLVVDDPPGSGASLARVIRDLDAPVLLVLQLFDGQELPEPLACHESVCLPWDEWAIHSLLRPAGADEVLGALAAGRDHARALFRVDGRVVLASGIGLGYFAGAAGVAAERLAGFLPRVLGTADGVLWREWLPEDDRADDPGAVAAYIAARAEALPVREDFALRQAGEFPAWEVAANLLTRAFGRAGPVAKLLGVDAAARRLLRIERPSLPDGWTGAGQWFSAGKVGFFERAHWHLGMAGFDPVNDLAGAAAGRDPEFVSALLGAYGQVEPEKLLLYELAHLWTHERLHPDDRGQARRAQGAAVRRYVGRRFLDDVAVSADGPVAALDLDGVLETEHLGFPSTTRSGALALRALVAGGYRPVLASGRSAVDVADRCADYGLPGGVAEYGAALVLGGEVRSLLAPEAAEALAHARELLAGVDLDPLYRHSIRARGLDAATVARVASECSLRAVPGDSQVDFVPSGIDKATGLAELLAELDAPGLAFAVGDTASDLPMLALAARGAAPGHAARALAPYRVRRPYQAGLLEAVEGLLGRSCDERLDPDAELLLTILSAQERGGRGIPGAALRLWRAA